jgi:hypothetical protein
MFTAALACGAADLRFHSSGGGAFEFDTGVLKGTLRDKGRSIGLLPVTHVPTGASLASSMGLCSIYRVFSDGQRYGKGMWDFASEAKLDGSGAVEVSWAPAADRPYGMRALYRWAAPDALDVTVSATAQHDLHGFEAFLASYYGKQFINASVWAKGGLKAAERVNGQWQMFPRNSGAVTLIRDGRWKHPPSPVDWAILPEFEVPVAVRRDPASAVLMSRAADCFAVATPDQTDSHYSSYLSLFGRDIRKGATARARVRLVILPAMDEGRIRGLYRGFVQGK